MLNPALVLVLPMGKVRLYVCKCVLDQIGWDDLVRCCLIVL